MKILVVEDDPPLRRSLQTTLESEGHQPICAGTGEEALALALAAGADFDVTVATFALQLPRFLY